MSVPAAIRARRTQLEQENPTPSDPPATPPAGNTPPTAPPSDPPAAPTPAANDDEDIFGQASPPASRPAEAPPSPGVDDMEQKYRSLQGMFAAKEREITELRRANETLTAAAAAARAAPPPTPAAPSPVAAPGAPTAPPSLTEEQMQRYAGSIPVIQRVAADMIASHLAPILAQLESMRGEFSTGVRSAEERVQAVARTTFQTTLYQQVPDLATLTKSPEFRQFIDTPIPYSGGRTVRAALRAAHEAQDVQTIAAIVADFRAQRKTAPPPVTPPSPGHFAQPTGASGQPPAQHEPGVPQMLPWSKRLEAGERFKRKQIAKDEFDKVAALYERAAKENRIDFSN